MKTLSLNEAQVVEKLKSWLRKMNPDAGEINIDSLLMEEGILDSFQFVNFLLYIEEILGHQIDRSNVIPESFATLEVILATFFESQAP